MLQSWINRTFVFWWRHSKSADRLNDWNYINDWNQPQLLFGLIQFWLFDMQMSWVTCNSLFLRGPRYRCATFQTGTWRHMQIICQLYANEFDRFVAFNRKWNLPISSLIFRFQNMTLQITGHQRALACKLYANEMQMWSTFVLKSVWIDWIEKLEIEMTTNRWPHMQMICKWYANDMQMICKWDTFWSWNGKNCWIPSWKWNFLKLKWRPVDGAVCKWDANEMQMTWTDFDLILQDRRWPAIWCRHYWTFSTRWSAIRRRKSHPQ